MRSGPSVVHSPDVGPARSSARPPSHGSVAESDVTNPDGLAAATGRQLRPGSQDLLAGLLGLGFAMGAGYLIGDLPMKQGARMSAGYFPKILAVIIGTLSAVLLIRGLWRKGDRISLDSPRPFLFVILSFVAFALLVGPAGFAAASAALVLVACLAERSHSLRTALLLAAALTIGAVILFAKILRVPVDIFPW